MSICAFTVGYEFLVGSAVAFDKCELSVTRNRKTNSANARVEIQYLVSLDMLGKFLEREFVNWQIDLEKAVGGVGILLA